MPNVGPIEVVVMLVIFALIIVVPYVLIVSLARVLHRSMPATMPPRDPALDALRTRFASGDLDEAEFERLRSVLQRR
ncbi:MAG: SHOCT domain-containing protein [Candidatus Limnocylindrales bacterium]